MTELQFRPRFRFNSELDPATVKERLMEAVRTRNGLHHFVLGGTGNHIMLAYPQNARTAWTPQMDVDLEPLPSGGTCIRCLIGPTPSIWMLFMGGYMLCVVLALLGLSIGVGQQVVGAETWGFMMVVPTPFIAVLLWTLAQGGKRRAREHMRALKRFMDEALGCDCFALAEQL
jgi:hypothetical protein